MIQPIKLPLFIKSFIIATLVFGGACLVLACSDAKPSIDQTMGLRIIQLNPKTSTMSQSLVFLAAIQYKDGIKNLQDIFVLNDNLQILWQINSAELQNIVYAGKTWVGTTLAQLAPGEPVPNGKFRLILNDRSGNTTAAELTLPRPEGDATALVPRLTTEGGRLLVTPPLRAGMQRELIVKDWSGTELARYAVQSDSIGIDNLLAGQNLTNRSYILVDSYPDEGLLLSSGPW